MRAVLRVALLTVSLALPSTAAAHAAIPSEPGGSTPVVQRPGGTGEPVVQRPGATSESLAPGTGADELSPGTGPVIPGTSPGVTPGPTTPPTPITTSAAPSTATPMTAPGATPGTAPAPVVRRGTMPRSQVGVVEAPAGGVKASPGGMPRYFRAPFPDSVWPSLVGRELLVVFGSGVRECVTLLKKTPDALFYVHRKNGNQQAPLSAVTSLHENSWECKTHDSTPSEWARSGAGTGIGFAALGLVMGGLYDAAHPQPRCERDAAPGVTCKDGAGNLPHFMYSVLGVSMTTLATPVVAIGGRSAGRDLRVKGKIWARATGWTLYGAATLMNILWLTGFYGDVESLQVRGLTTGAGVLGLGGAALMSVDALMARQELISLRRQDSQRSDRPSGPTARGGLRFGAQPIGNAGQMHGLSLGVGGRF